MFIKMNVREYLEESGCEIEDIVMCDKEVVCVYMRSDGEGGSVG